MVDAVPSSVNVRSHVPEASPLGTAPECGVWRIKTADLELLANVSCDQSVAVESCRPSVFQTPAGAPQNLKTTKSSLRRTEVACVVDVAQPPGALLPEATRPENQSSEHGTISAHVELLRLDFRDAMERCQERLDRQERSYEDRCRAIDVALADMNTNLRHEIQAGDAALAQRLAENALSRAEGALVSDRGCPDIEDKIVQIAKVCTSFADRFDNEGKTTRDAVSALREEMAHLSDHCIEINRVRSSAADAWQADLDARTTAAVEELQTSLRKDLTSDLHAELGVCTRVSEDAVKNALASHREQMRLNEDAGRQDMQAKLKEELSLWLSEETQATCAHLEALVTSMRQDMQATLTADLDALSGHLDAAAAAADLDVKLANAFADQQQLMDSTVAPIRQQLDLLSRTNIDTPVHHAVLEAAVASAVKGQRQVLEDAFQKELGTAAAAAREESLAALHEELDRLPGENIRALEATRQDLHASLREELEQLSCHLFAQDRAHSSRVDCAVAAAVAGQMQLVADASAQQRAFVGETNARYEDFVHQLSRFGQVQAELQRQMALQAATAPTGPPPSVYAGALPIAAGEGVAAPDSGASTPRAQAVAASGSGAPGARAFAERMARRDEELSARAQAGAASGAGAITPPVTPRTVLPNRIELMPKLSEDAMPSPVLQDFVPESGMGGDVSAPAGVILSGKAVLPYSLLSRQQSGGMFRQGSQSSLATVSEQDDEEVTPTASPKSQLRDAAPPQVLRSPVCSAVVRDTALPDAVAESPANAVTPLRCASATAAPITARRQSPPPPSVVPLRVIAALGVPPK